jgi:hypothetical protein
VVSPVEYETLGLLGTNCGVSDPDDLAQLNAIANDLGVDTIELGATLGVLMEAGVGEFGDVQWMAASAGRDRGRHGAGAVCGRKGTARVGAHYKVSACPRHQEAGDQRLRPARRRGDRHDDDGDGAGRRPHRGQSAAPQDTRDGFGDT